MIDKRTETALKYLDKYAKEMYQLHEQKKDPIKYLNFKNMKKEFNSLVKNSIDSEFEKAIDFSFVKIIDETLPSPDSYFGLIDDSCF